MNNNNNISIYNIEENNKGNESDNLIDSLIIFQIKNLEMNTIKNNLN